MNREDVMRMAREANVLRNVASDDDALERFAAFVAAAEREACALACEDFRLDADPRIRRYQLDTILACAAFIRARNNK